MRSLVFFVFLVIAATFLFNSVFAQNSGDTQAHKLSYSFGSNNGIFSIPDSSLTADLGKFHILVPPITYSFRVTNSGTDSVTISEVNFAGDPEFSVYMVNILPYTLQPNQIINLSTYSYVPNDSGIRKAELIIKSNSLNSPDTIRLVAETVDPGFGPWEWELLGCPFGDCNINSIDIDPKDDNIWYVSSASELYITRDGGVSWEKGLSCNLCYPHIVAIDPTNPNRVYAGAMNNLYGSIDKGISWSLLRAFPSFSPTFGAVTSATINSNDGTLYVPYNVGIDENDTNPGVYISSDYGSTWSFHSFGINEDRIISWDIEHDPFNGILYVCTEIGDHPQPYNPPFFRSLDNGITWEEVSNELYWHGIKIQINPDNQVVYCLLEAANVYKSSDYGSSWENKSYAGWYDMILDSLHDNCLFGSKSTFGGVWKGGVYVSMDETVHHDDLIGLTNLSVGSLRLNSSSTKLFAISSGVGIFMTPVPEVINVAPFLIVWKYVINPNLYSVRIISSENGVVYIVPEDTEKSLDIIRNNSVDSITVNANIEVKIYASNFKNGNYWIYAVDNTGLISRNDQFTVSGNPDDPVDPIDSVMVTGLEDNHLYEILIFPNPANEMITVQTNRIDKYLIEVTNLYGQIIYRKNTDLDLFQIDISSYQKGLYIVTIESEFFLKSKRIIKF